MCLYPCYKFVRDLILNFNINFFLHNLIKHKLNIYYIHDFAFIFTGHFIKSLLSNRIFISPHKSTNLNLLKKHPFPCQTKTLHLQLPLLPGSLLLSSSSSSRYARVLSFIPFKTGAFTYWLASRRRKCCPDFPSWWSSSIWPTETGVDTLR